jgi:hypothetical protein
VLRIFQAYKKSVKGNQMENILNAQLTRKQAAQLLRVGLPFLSKLEKDGVLHANASGTFKLTDLWKEYFNYLETRRSSAKLESQAKLTQLKIDKMEREALIANKELLPINVFQEWILEYLGKMTMGLQAVGARVTRDRELMRKIDAIIAEEVNKTVEAITDIKETIQ